MSERDTNQRGYGSLSPPRTERHDRQEWGDRQEPSRAQQTERLHADSPSKHDVQFYIRKVNRYEAEISRLEHELSVTRFRLSKAQDFQSKYDQLFKQNQQTIIDSLEIHQNLEKTKRDYDKLQQDYVQAQQNIKSLKNDLDNQKKANNQLRHKGEELVGRSNEEGQEEKEAIRQAHNREVENLKAETRDLKQRLSRQIAELNSQIAHKQTTEQSLQAKLSHIKKQKNQEIDRLKELVGSLRHQVSANHCESEDRARKARNALITQTQGRIASVRALSRSIQDTLVGEINSLNDTLTKKNQQIAFLLQCDKKQLQDHESSQQALKALIQRLQDKIFTIQRQNQLQLYQTIQRLKSQYQQNLDATAKEWESIRLMLQANEDALKKQIKELKAQLDLVNNQNQNLERQNKKITKDNQESMNMLSQKIIQMENQRDQSLKNYTTSMKQIEDDAKSKLDDLHTAIRNKEGEAQILNAQMNLKNGQISHLLQEISKLRQTNREKIQRLQNTNNSEQTALNNQIAGLKSQVFQFKKTVLQLQGRLADSQTDFQLKMQLKEQQLQNQREANELLKARNHFLAQWCTELQRDLKAERVSNVNILHDQNIAVRENVQAREEVKVELQALKAKEMEQLRNIHRLQKTRLQSQLSKKQHELREKKEELARLLAQYKNLQAKVGKPSKIDRSAEDEGKCRATLQAQILLTENVFNLINRQ